jgi:hypothetical protein
MRQHTGDFVRRFWYLQRPRKHIDAATRGAKAFAMESAAPPDPVRSPKGEEQCARSD